MVPGCSAQLEASDEWFLNLTELTPLRGRGRGGFNEGDICTNFISTNTEQIKKVGL